RGRGLDFGSNRRAGYVFRALRATRPRSRWQFATNGECAPAAVRLAVQGGGFGRRGRGAGRGLGGRRSRRRSLAAHAADRRRARGVRRAARKRDRSGATRRAFAHSASRRGRGSDRALLGHAAHSLVSQPANWQAGSTWYFLHAARLRGADRGWLLGRPEAVAHPPRATASTGAHARGAWSGAAPRADRRQRDRGRPFSVPATDWLDAATRSGWRVEELAPARCRLCARGFFRGSQLRSH